MSSLLSFYRHMLTAMYDVLLGQTDGPTTAISVFLSESEQKRLEIPATHYFCYNEQNLDKHLLYNQSELTTDDEEEKNQATRLLDDYAYG